VTRSKPTGGRSAFVLAPLALAAILPLGRPAGAQSLPGDASHPGQFHCPPPPPDLPDFSEALAWIDFPRLGLLVPVYEGVAESSLRRGAGHVPGTALPGTSDGYRNCVIAAHRTTFFSPLESIVRGDVFSVLTPLGAEEFVVDRTLVVTPEHVELEAATPEKRMTLVTCTPFNYLGSAPRRLVVLASPRERHAGK
jgi:sortase A